MSRSLQYQHDVRNDSYDVIINFVKSLTFGELFNKLNALRPYEYDALFKIDMLYFFLQGRVTQ